VSQAPLTNVSTVQLAYLAAIARSRTWGAAAASLGVTPSALSQGVAELERRLGIDLFAWEGRRRVPLAHTVEVVLFAERVLADTADMSRWLNEVRTAKVGQVRVGMIDAAAVVHFPQVLRQFRANRPELDLHLSVAPTGELLDALAAGRLDVAICVDPAGVGDFDIAPLLNEDLAVYGPPAALTAGANDSLSDPSTWGPWVLFPPDSRTRAVIERELRAIGVTIEVEGESHQPEVLCEMVRMGLGYSVLPVSQAEHGPEPLTRVREQPIARRSIVAATRHSGPRHPAAVELITELQSFAGASDQ
jgi:DNA-binding transcriptional LysR family regulator